MGKTYKDGYNPKRKDLRKKRRKIKQKSRNTVKHEENMLFEDSEFEKFYRRKRA